MDEHDTKVGDVAQAADEHDTKVSLVDPVPDPMQVHVVGLGHPLRHLVGSNADGHLVVAEQWGGGLGVAHVGQDVGQDFAPTRQRNRQQRCGWSGRRWGG